MLVTMRDRRSRSEHEVNELLRNHYGRAVFHTEIPYSGTVAEAPSFGKTILQ
jgi:cellulose biosynthesis protein BcsQ